MDQCKILLEIQILIAKIICKYCCLYLSVPNHQKTQIRSKSKHLKGHITVLDLHNPLNKESVLKHEKQQNAWNTATIYIFKGICRFSCFQTLSVFKGFCRFTCFKTLSVFKGFCHFPVSRPFPFSKVFENRKNNQIPWKNHYFQEIWSFFLFPITLTFQKCLQTGKTTKSLENNDFFTGFGRFSCFQTLLKRESV